MVPKDHKLLIDLFYENKIVSCLCIENKVCDSFFFILQYFIKWQTRNDLVGRVSLPMDNSRIIISNENEANAFNRIDFPLEKRTIFNKVKGKLTLIVHWVSSMDSVNQIADLSLAPHTTTGRGGSRPSITPSTAAVVAAASTSASPLPSAPETSEPSTNAQTPETNVTDLFVSFFKSLYKNFLRLRKILRTKWHKKKRSLYR